jgi:hypothetical protein
MILFLGFRDEEAEELYRQRPPSSPKAGIGLIVAFLLHKKLFGSTKNANAYATLSPRCRAARPTQAGRGHP